MLSIGTDDPLQGPDLFPYLQLESFIIFNYYYNPIIYLLEITETERIKETFS